MNKEFSHELLLIVLHVLAKQGKINAAQFIDDLREVAQKWLNENRTLPGREGTGPFNAVLEQFVESIEGNLPMSWLDPIPEPPDLTIRPLPPRPQSVPPEPPPEPGAPQKPPRR